MEPLRRLFRVLGALGSGHIRWIPEGRSLVVRYVQQPSSAQDERPSSRTKAARIGLKAAASVRWNPQTDMYV